MKKVLVCIWAITLPLFVRGESTHLVISSKDGTQVAFALQEQPRLTFVESELRVLTSKLDVSYALENMANFTYEERDTVSSNVINLQETGVMYFLNNEYIVFPSLTEGTEISLATITGAMIFSQKLTQAGEYTCHLSHLMPSVYLLKVNNLTYKIIKR